MKKLLKRENKNLIVKECHFERLMGEESINWLFGTSPRRAQHAQSGRSMVEMLGVLAVMGVISVGGVSAYSSAMRRHRANELINEASKRAVVLAMKVSAGQQLGENALAEFDNNTVSGTTFGAVGTQDNTFTIALSGASELCDQLKTQGEGSIMAFNEECTQITFNKDLSRGVTSYNGSASGNNSGNDNTNDTPVGACDAFPGTSLTGAGGFVPGYPCACENAGDGWNGSACQTGYEDPDDGSGSCSGSGSGSGCEVNLGACATNGDCAQYEECAGGVCFCRYSSAHVDCQMGPTADGSCQIRKFGHLPSGATSEGFFRSKGYMDWYSAKNFCASYNNGQMVHLSDIGVGTAAGQYLSVPANQTRCSGNTSCGLDGNNGTTAAQKWSAIQAKFGNNWNPWVADLSPSGTTNTNSCVAFTVDFVNSSADVIDYARSTRPFYALCK